MMETNKINSRKKEMAEFIASFKQMPDRLLKYCEILLEGKQASPYSYQDAMSFRHLAISLTSRCNKRCFWCNRFDPMYKKVLNKDLPFAKLKKIVVNTKSRFRRIHLAGLGEPALYPRLLDAIALVRKLSDHVVFTSNASLLNRDLIVQAIKRGLTDIQISINSFAEEGEKKISGVELMHSLEIVVYISNQTNLDLQVNTVVSSLNYQMLFTLVDRLKEVKKMVLHTIPLFETRQCLNSGVRRVSAEDYKALLVKIKSDIDKYHLSWIMLPSPEGSIIDPVIEMKKKKNICFSCFEDPYISEAGELLHCPRTIPYGGVDATVGFEKAWNHPKLLKFRQNMLKGRYPALCGQLCYLKERNKNAKS